MEDFGGSDSDTSLPDNEEVYGTRPVPLNIPSVPRSIRASTFAAPRRLPALLPSSLFAGSGGTIDGHAAAVPARPPFFAAQHERRATSPTTPAAAIPPSQRRELVVNWTVKKPGKTKAPTTNDYAQWDLDQLRKECTARGKKISRKIADEGRVRMAWLEENDLDRDQILISVDPAFAIPADVRQTVHSMIRLINVCLSDDFVDELVRSDDAPKRTALDTRAVNGKSPSWVRLAAAYCENEVDYNGLFTDDPQFAGFKPWRITKHDSVALFGMWSSLMKLYKAAYEKSTRSGEHSNDFASYCDGRLDVAYLHVGVGIKPQVADFVRGGMPEGSMLDSTRPTQNTSGQNAKRGRSTTSHGHEISSLQETLKTLANYVMSNPVQEARAVQVTPSKKDHGKAEILKCMAMSYPLLQQLETSRAQAVRDGQPTLHLDRAIELQRQGIQDLEDEYAAAMEQDKPRKRSRRTTTPTSTAPRDGEEDEIIIV